MAPDQQQRQLAARIRELPRNERPRERLARLGVSALSDAEVLAVVLGGGVAGESALELAQRLLTQFGGWDGLQQADSAELAQQHGIGNARSAAIKGALDIARRLVLATGEQPFQVRSPRDVVRILQLEMGYLSQEHLRVVCLTTKNRVQRIHTVYVGSLNTAFIRIGEVLREPIRLNSAALIVAHNHPSQDPTPSPEDVLVTRQIVEASKLMDIEALDHLVICAHSFVSMRERRLGFP